MVYGWSTGTPTEFDEAELARRDISVVRFGVPDDLRPLEDRALAAAATRELVPVVGQQFAVEDAADVHRAIEARATTGKTVLRP